MTGRRCRSEGGRHAARGLQEIFDSASLRRGGKRDLDRLATPLASLGEVLQRERGYVGLGRRNFGIDHRLLERVAKFRRGLVARVGRVRERLSHDRGDGGVDARRKRHRRAPGRKKMERSELILRLVRRLPAEEIVENDADGPEVCASIDRLTERLLGGHVLRLPFQDAGVLSPRSRATAPSRSQNQ